MVQVAYIGDVYPVDEKMNKIPSSYSLKFCEVVTLYIHWVSVVIDISCQINTRLKHQLPCFNSPTTFHLKEASSNTVISIFSFKPNILFLGSLNK